MLLKITKLSTTLLIALSIFVSAIASAEPRTVPTKITSMRPYTDGSYFITVADRNLANSSGNITICTNSTFKVQSDAAGAKSVIASLLTAYALDSDVQIEFPTAETECGFGTLIQSVFLL